MKDNKQELKEIRGVLIQALAAYNVRKEMCLPILLMIGQNEQAMLLLMAYMRDNDPLEHQIIQRAMVLEDYTHTNGDGSGRGSGGRTHFLSIRDISTYR